MGEGEEFGEHGGSSMEHEFLAAMGLCPGNILQSSGGSCPRLRQATYLIF